MRQKLCLNILLVHAILEQSKKGRTNKTSLVHISNRVFQAPAVRDAVKIKIKIVRS